MPRTKNTNLDFASVEGMYVVTVAINNITIRLVSYDSLSYIARIHTPPRDPFRASLHHYTNARPGHQSSKSSMHVDLDGMFDTSLYYCSNTIVDGY